VRIHGRDCTAGSSPANPLGAVRFGP
jgi:hypothetical protein